MCKQVTVSRSYLNHLVFYLSDIAHLLRVSVFSGEQLSAQSIQSSIKYSRAF